MTVSARKPAKRRRHQESDHGRALVTWWAHCAPMFGLEPADLVHVPNGGARSPREGARLKAEGVRAGYPDYVLDVPRGTSAGLRLELKPPGGSPPRPHQLEHLQRLETRGYTVAIAYGWHEARNAIEDYLKQ